MDATHLRLVDAPTAESDDLLTILRASNAAQAEAARTRTPSAPPTCGDARLGGQHLWRNTSRSLQGQHVACPCGARARFGFDGDLFEDVGYGPPPADPVAAEVA